MRTRSAAHTTIDTGGLLLHALEFGGDGPPLLFIHGVTGHAWLWHATATRLTNTARCFALDLRGHGDSQRSPSHQYSTADHVADLEHVIDRLDLQPVTLVGISWGALVACGYSVQNPQHVDRLVVIDFEPRSELAPDQVSQRPHHFPNMPAVEEWERSANPYASDEVIQNMAWMSVRPGNDGGWERKHDPYFIEHWPFRAEDHWPVLGQIARPTMFVHAAESFVRLGVMEQACNTVLAAQLVEIEHSTHLIPLEQPDLLADVIEAFISGTAKTR